MSSLRIMIAAALIIAGSAASGQILQSVPLPQVSLPGGSGGGLLGGIGQAVDPVTGGVLGQSLDGTISRQVSRADIQRAINPSLARLATDRWIQSAPPATLADLRRLRLAELVKDNRAVLEMDGAGNPARRGVVVAIDPEATDLAAAARAGFRVTADERNAEFGIRMVTLSVPRGASTAQGLRLLRRAAPRMVADFDHVFEPAGGTLAATSVALAAANVEGNGRLIGMIDGGVGRAPALASASIEQKGFAGAAQATGHGTAVASLIVGSDGKFAGAARGARLLVGDVYGGNPAAGSATSVVNAMAWIASKRPSVINVSLVGPRNALVSRAVEIVLARGIQVVAAVGNDGPAAPPLYPASQAGVIAVTGVDGANRALAEAGRSAHLDYAGPGADMAAALPGKGYATVRGTSFAAPFVTARLAMTGSTARLDSELARGHGRIGKGVVCATCRIAPKQVGAK